MKKGNIILVDFCAASDWDFKISLSQSSMHNWTVVSEPTNTLHGSSFANLRRVLLYFLFPLKLAFQKFEENAVLLAWQQFYGLNLAFWYKLFNMQKRYKIIVMTFIYKKKKGIKGKLYQQYMNYIVNSGYVDCFICFSSKECNYYKRLFNNDSFFYVPLGIPTMGDCSSNTNSDYKYIFSTGRSNRDYDFLINTLEDSKYNLIIACDSLKAPSSESVIILNNCFGEDMRNKMRNCYCVVVTVANRNISSGQLVILQAMQLGKPVIATQSSGIEDYIEDGITGLLINNTKDELLRALDKLYSDKNLYDTISNNAQSVFYEKHTMEAMGRNVATIINDINKKGRL